MAEDPGKLPTLDQIWPTAHSITGKDIIGGEGDSGGGKDATEPTHSVCNVSPGSIRDGEDAILRDTNGQVADFEAFKKDLLSYEAEMFAITETGTTSTGVSTTPGSSGLQGMQSGESTTDTDPDRTAKMVAGQHDLLRAVAGAIEQVGQFAGMLNNAAQIYAGADEAAFPIK